MEDSPISRPQKLVRWGEEIKKLYTEEFKESFDRLNPTDKKRFIRRNGFNPTTFKDFVESAVMVLIYNGRITEDIKIKDGKFYIDPQNLTKREVFGTKVILNLPRVWDTVPAWAMREFDKFKPAKEL